MSYKTFSNQVKSGDIKSIYLLYGQESYLLDKAKELLQDSVVTAFPELNYITLDGDTLTVEQLQNACETFPFGSEKKLVVVKHPGFLKRANSKKDEEDEEQSETESEQKQEENPKKEAGEQKRYMELFGELPESCCLLLLYYGELGKSKKLFDSIKKNGEVFEFTRVDKDDLTKWVKNNFGKYNMKIGFKELDYFITMSGYSDKKSDKNLYNLENEINKISALAGSTDTITIEHIEAVMPRNLENDIFKLINSCADRKVANSLSILQDLLMRGEEIFAVLAMITKQIRTMIAVVELNQKGMDAKAASAKLKVHEFYAKNCLNYGKKIGIKGLISALNNSVEVENSVKSGKMDKRLALEMLMMNMFE